MPHLKATLKNPHLIFLVSWALVIVGSFLAYRFGWVWYFNLASKVPQDFTVYWVAAERLSQGIEIYNPADHLPFKYSPLFAYAFRYSFYLLGDQRFTAAVWQTLSSLAFFGVLIVWSRSLLRDGHKPLQTVLGILIGLLFGWHGFLENLGFGQIDLFLGAGLLWIGAQISQEIKPFSSSLILRCLVWATLLSIKPQIGLIWLLVTPLFGVREAVVSAICGASFYISPFLVLGMNKGISLYLSWFHCLKEQQDTAFMIGNFNQNFASVVVRLIHKFEWFGWIEEIGVAAYLILLGAFLVHARSQSRSFDQSERSRSDKTLGQRSDPILNRGNRLEKTTQLLLFSAGISGYLLFSPLSWRWFSFLWIPCVTIISHCARSKREWILALAPWGFFAVFTKTFIVSQMTWLSRGDQVSYLGMYMWAGMGLYVASLTMMFKSVRINQG